MTRDGSVLVHVSSRSSHCSGFFVAGNQRFPNSVLACRCRRECFCSLRCYGQEKSYLLQITMISSPIFQRMAVTCACPWHEPMSAPDDQRASFMRRTSNGIASTFPRSSHSPDHEQSDNLTSNWTGCRPTMHFGVFL